MLQQLSFDHWSEAINKHIIRRQRSGHVKDITGQRFGLLTVKEFTGIGEHGGSYWLCKCDCGGTIITSSHSLIGGNTKSCGCLQAESRHLRKKHGGKGTRRYGVWKGMKCRCYTKSSSSYKHYGARGIKVCDEWVHDYQAFHDWAFANGYDPKAPTYECTIDRIDPNGNYEPSNCRWVDMKAQNANRRPFKHGNRYTKAKGESRAIHH
jgi:hypothetical protein